MIEKKARESPTGLYRAEGGELMFPDGKQVRGVNSGIFAQSKDTNDLIDEVKGKMKKEADEKASADKKQKEKEDLEKKQKEADARWEKADRFTGTVHEKDGSRSFAPEGTKVGGVNNHVQVSDKK